MHLFHHSVVHILMAIFLIGAAGCLLVIPVVALKFLSVLFEHKHEEHPPSEHRDVGD